MCFEYVLCTFAVILTQLTMKFTAHFPSSMLTIYIFFFPAEIQKIPVVIELSSSLKLQIKSIAADWTQKLYFLIFR